MAVEHVLLVGDVTGMALLQSRSGGASWETTHKVLDAPTYAIKKGLDGFIYAGTRGAGLWRSQHASGKWQQIETPAAANKVRALCPIEDGVLVGAEPMGLFEWTGTRGWKQLGNLETVSGSSKWYYPDPREEPHVRDVSYDPQDPQRIYCALQVGGIAISPDYGAHWHDVLDLDLDVHMIEPHPLGTGTVYAGTGGRGLYKSVDSGATWQEISAGCGNFVIQFAFDYSRPDRLFLGTAHGYPPDWLKEGGAGGELFRSEDGGGTWSKLANGLPGRLESHVTAVFVHPDVPQLVFFAGGLSFRGAIAKDGGVYCSTDGGDHWRLIHSSREPLALCSVTEKT